MSRFALGKKSKFISDRSGFAFPYRERVMEWNGNLVHRSEYERKHPCLLYTSPSPRDGLLSRMPSSA